MRSVGGLRFAGIVSLVFVAACGTGPEPEPVPPPEWSWHPRLDNHALLETAVAGNGDVFLLLHNGRVPAVRRWNAATGTWNGIVELPTTYIPRLAVDDAGGALLAWGDAGGAVHVMSFAAGSAGALGWSATRQVASPGDGVSDVRSVTMAADGSAAVVWERRPDPEQFVWTHHVALFDPSRGWTAEQLLPGAAQVAVADLGSELRVAAAWTDGRAVHGDVLTLDRGTGEASWQGEARLDDASAYEAYLDGVGIDALGNARVLFRTSESAFDNLVVASHVGEAWAAPVVLFQHDRGASLFTDAASLAVGRDGAALVAWSLPCAPSCSVPVWRSSGTGWNEAVELVTADPTREQVSPSRVAATGSQAMVMWTESLHDTVTDRYRQSVVSAWFDGREWTPPREVATGETFPFDLSLSIRDSSGVVAWMQESSSGVASVIVGTYRAP